MGNPSDKSIATEGEQSLSSFRELYDKCVPNIVQWSEGDILKPQYLQLHEKYLGSGDRGYQLGKYVISFLESLGDLIHAFRRIVFCYSYEETDPHYPALQPGDCRRERFYWYELKVPEARRPVISEITCPGGTIETMWQDPVDLRDLPALLGTCQWVQPYMLRQDMLWQGGVAIDALYQLEANSPRLRETLVEWHRAFGSYQFSIYGFELREDHFLTDAETLLINMAFLIHIWTWNHDLRTMHLLRRAVLEKLPESLRRWEAFHGHMQDFLDMLHDLHLVESDEHTDDIIPLSDQFVDELFEQPHDLSMWTPESFPKFLKQGHSARTASEFLIYCGWSNGTVEPMDDPVFRTWARGTWLATKYLTRCALDDRKEDYKKLSFDQVLLAALFGLRRGGATNLPVRVVRTVELPNGVSNAESTALIETYLAFAEKNHNWPKQQLSNVAVHQIDTGKRVEITWDYVGIEKESLPAFLRSGILAMQMSSPYLHVFALPMREPPLRPAYFLNRVARAAQGVARQLQYASAKYAKPSRLVAEIHTVVNAARCKTHQATLRFELDGLLPDEATYGTGELGGPIGNLAKLFGYRKPIRVNQVTSDAWNWFVVTREGQYDDLVLTFEKGTS